MTRLGSTFVSEDTDTRGQTGPAGNASTVPGPAGEDSTVPGPAGEDGIVASVVAGTNISVDNTDPANPIVSSSAPAADPLTTKGDLFGFDTDAARIPVGTDGQVLEADSTQALGLKWETPSAGGAAASINGLIPGTNFLMCGEISTSSGQIVDQTISLNEVKLDFIFFQTETTISEVSVRSATASSGGTLIVGLHPMADRVSLGTQDFVASIPVGTSSNTTHTDVLGTAWVVPAGWYGLVTYNDQAGIITILLHRMGGSTAGYGSGRFYTGAAQIANTTSQEAEIKTIFLESSTYAASPDLTSIDFNDPALYKVTPVDGELGSSTRIPIVFLKVTSA